MDSEGNVIARISDVIPHPATLRPEWFVVRTGRIGGEHLVPVEAVVSTEDGQVVAPFGKDRIKHAPRAKEHASPSRPERDALYEYYGLAVPPGR
jgi:hypothetical protein